MRMSNLSFCEAVVSYTTDNVKKKFVCKKNERNKCVKANIHCAQFDHRLFIFFWVFVNVICLFTNTATKTTTKLKTKNFVFPQTLGYFHLHKFKSWIGRPFGIFPCHQITTEKMPFDSYWSKAWTIVCLIKRSSKNIFSAMLMRTDSLFQREWEEEKKNESTAHIFSFNRISVHSNVYVTVTVSMLVFFCQWCSIDIMKKRRQFSVTRITYPKKYTTLTKIPNYLCLHLPSELCCGECTVFFSSLELNLWGLKKKSEFHVLYIEW